MYDSDVKPLPGIPDVDEDWPRAMAKPDGTPGDRLLRFDWNTFPSAPHNAAEIARVVDFLDHHRGNWSLKPADMVMLGDGLIITRRHLQAAVYKRVSNLQREQRSFGAVPRAGDETCDEVRPSAKERNALSSIYRDRRCRVSICLNTGNWLTL